MPLPLWRGIFRSLLLIVKSLMMSMLTMGAVTAIAAEEASESLPTRYDKGPDAFHSYLPTYIGVTPRHSGSANEGELKLQFSVKYEVVSGTNWYFGYTQKSFWSIQDNSAPFRETNYAPETFWIYKPSGLAWLPAVQTGIYRHESTGESGVGSQGWDITYLEPVFRWRGLYLIPRLWAPSIVQRFDSAKAAPDNPDIFRYYGYGTLTALYGSKNEVQVSLTLQHAPKDDSIAWEGQIDVAWRSIAKGFNRLFGHNYEPELNPFFFLQARNGYGEGLKTYQVKTSSVVLGISLVR